MSTIRDVKYLEKHLDQLVGGKVVAIGSREDELGVWPVLNVEMPGGKLLVIEVSRDAEGNGPGHMFIGEGETA